MKGGPANLKVSNAIRGRAPVNPQTICNRCVSLVGLPDAAILDVEDIPGAALRVHVELTRSPQGSDARDLAEAQVPLARSRAVLWGPGPRTIPGSPRSV